ncbi:putative membrane protein YqjE [Pseudarthrobacter siccitolerans]|uniref:Membrane protein YqjE n=1 Tax=Pseudarthrobacter siccitolerans TaxID=861266 RepID=A0ABU0PT36_9MICC|nr:phage holin family protein [Pseudarthrobacter siccitolerans]MDQ0676414.1 putative membrane protein YqjE [Pseudarthrobacter siccitolerans]
MSGRHSGRTSQGVRIAALPGTLKLLSRLAPRQLNDEIAFAKIELKRKGVQVGVAAAFLAVALIFVLFLAVGLIVAAIMGLATIMPAWLAALIVSAAFLLIALIGGLIGVNRFKKAMPLLPEETIRGIKHDIGVAKEGSAFNPAVLDPQSPEAKAAKAAKAEAAVRAKAEKEAKAEEHNKEFPQASEPELARRLSQRRHHITEVRDDLGDELDVKTQARFLLGAAQVKLREGQVIAGRSKDLAARRLAALSESTGGLGNRWKPLAAFAAAGTVFVVLVRKLLRTY